VSDNVDFIPWLDDEYPDSDYGYNQTSGVKDAYYEDVAAGTETTVDGTADTDATVTLNSTTPVGVTILLYEENPEGTNQGAYAIGKYLDVSVNDTSGVQWPINITLYYTQDDLDAAGLTEDDLIGIMFWNSSAMQWQYYNNTGVNKDYFDGTYIGYVWANVWHLTPVGLGGNDTTPPTTTKVVGQPKYGALPPYNQYVTTHTPIWLNASDGANESGLNATYYRIWYNNVWHPANSTDYYGGNHNITLIGSTYWYVYYKNGSISFGPIYFTEECHHKLQFYSIDNAGNNENVTTQDHYVDDTPPQSYLMVQDPKWPQNQGATFVTTSTVITLGANDIYGSCNVGSFYMHWRIWNGTWTPWHVGSRGEVINITFNEECKHYIEYYSEDNLGNVETTIHNRTFYVDESPPTSSIELGNPSYGNCITSQTPIWINATDPNAPCNSDNNSIYYHIWNSTSGWTTWMHTVHANLMTYIKDECKHYIEYYAVDALGNTESTIHNITLYVDDSTPVIVKTVGNPNVTVAPGEYYVTTSTPIIINATDVGCCPGMTVEYKVDSGAWNDITSSLPFTYQFTTEGLHTLYIRAYDNLGNIAYDNETFHVDNSPPAINKTVGNPNCNISSTEYCVTTSTLITINASDEAGLKNVSYRIWYSGTWTSWQNITSSLPYTFTFTEECEHYLEIYVEDDLGNDQVDNETFYVDDTTPVINKTVGDPNVTGSGTPDYWVTTSTPITIDASDAGCCANMTVQYRIWNSTADTGWITISVPYTLYFTEECEHNLSIRAYDCLGHITYENETFYVDDSGPVVTKEVGQPQYGNFVTQHTPIWVNATDTGCNGGVGIERIRVYLWVDTDNDNTWDVAYSPFPSGMVYDNDANDLDSTVGRISVRVYFGEDTHHLIEWNSWDYLGNSGGYHSQAHYVDTVPPDSAVVFGSPSCNISSTEYCVTTSTPIWINATDNGTESWCTVGSYTIHWVIWNSTGIYDQGTSSDTNVSLTIGEECNHTLGYWVEDDLGNRWPSVGYYNITIHVDDTYPTIVKTVGSPNCTINSTTWCVTNSTPIYIDAYDNGCCNNLTIEYAVDGGTYTPITVPYIFNFSSYLDGVHTLSIKAYDCLGHVSYDNETFYVDDSYPAITKIVGDPNVTGSGTPDYWVTTMTPITINASDAGPCSSLYVEISTDGVSWTMITVPYIFHFTEECYHTLYIKAYDCLGHVSYDNETFNVDDSSPVVNKTIVGGGYNDGSNYYVNQSAVIYLNVTDLPDCAVGGWTLHYRIWWNGSWITDVMAHTNQNFSFAHDCKHYLEYYVNDSLGNRWPATGWHNETFFVDSVAPTSTLVVGDPKYPHDQTATYVTTHTNLTIYGSDDDENCSQGTGTWIVHYRIWHNGWGPEHIGNVWETLNTTFTDECVNYIEYWATDLAGNEEAHHNRTFYVDDTPPYISLNVGSPNVPSGSDYYVTLDTPVSLNATDNGLTPQCTVGVFTIHYRIWFNETWTPWTASNTNVSIDFTENCTHYLEYWVEDELGNRNPTSGVYNTTFYVGGGLPTVSLELGSPNCGDYITKDTPIYINATGLPQHSNFVIYYNITNETGVTYTGWLNGPWNENVTFTFAGLGIYDNCTHIIYYNITDGLGHWEEHNYTVHVDNINPTINMNVGSPKYGSYVTSSTPFWINASDDTCASGITEIHYNILYNGIWHNYVSTANVTFTFGGFAWNGPFNHPVYVTPVSFVIL